MARQCHKERHFSSFFFFFSKVGDERLVEMNRTRQTDRHVETERHWEISEAVKLITCGGPIVDSPG